MATGCAPSSASTPRVLAEAPPLAAHPSAPLRPRPVSPGERVRGALIVVPPRVAVGDMVDLRAPAGSRIEGFGATVIAGADGRARLPAPAEEGRHFVRVTRPDGHMMRFRVEIVESTSPR